MDHSLMAIFCSFTSKRTALSGQGKIPRLDRTGNNSLEFSPRNYYQKVCIHSSFCASFGQHFVPKSNKKRLQNHAEKNVISECK